MSRILVTGGTGYVAGWCIVQLLQAGHEVRASVRSLDKSEQVREAVGREVDPGDRLDFAAAELTSADGWDAAVEGCAGVLHVASPLGGADGDDLIIQAREGALNVLAAACRAETPRVVLTSSCAAATPRADARELTADEATWTDSDEPGLAAYRRSKVIAERAAWDFMATRSGPTELVTVLPAAIFGPTLSVAALGSLEIIARLLDGRMPAVPRLAFEVVDVRDVADAHLRALTTPEAAGKRFIAAGQLLWLTEIAEILRERLGPEAAAVPTRRMPDLAMRLAARFNADLREVLPLLGRRLQHSSAHAEQVLGWRARPAAETIEASARSLIDLRR